MICRIFFRKHYRLNYTKHVVTTCFVEFNRYCFRKNILQIIFVEYIMSGKLYWMNTKVHEWIWRGAKDKWTNLTRRTFCNMAFIALKRPNAIIFENSASITGPSSRLSFTYANFISFAWSPTYFAFLLVLCGIPMIKINPHVGNLLVKRPKTITLFHIGQFEVLVISVAPWLRWQTSDPNSLSIFLFYRWGIFVKVLQNVNVGICAVGVEVAVFT